jgi:hypothetical protein
MSYPIGPLILGTEFLYKVHVSFGIRVPRAPTQAQVRAPELVGAVPAVAPQGARIAVITVDRDGLVRRECQKKREAPGAGVRAGECPT